MSVDFEFHVAPRVIDLLNTIDEGSEAQHVRAALAVSVAMKLDEAVADDSATSSMATSGLSKELRATLDELLAGASSKQTMIAAIFSE